MVVTRTFLYWLLVIHNIFISVQYSIGLFIYILTGINIYMPVLCTAVAERFFSSLRHYLEVWN